jgi:membrane associated rhomboid family serine protease
MRLVNKIKNEFLNANILYKLIYINVAIYLILEITKVIINIFLIDINFNNDKFLLSDTKQLISQPWSLLTYIFFHDNIFHLLFTTIWLHFGGKLFLQYFSERQFITTYFLGGISGGLLYIISIKYLPSIELLHRNNELGPLIGSSGAVLAILIAITTHIPNYNLKIPLMGFIRVKYIAYFLLLSSILGIDGSNGGGNTAHIGGAIFGFLYIKLQTNTKRSKTNNKSFIKYLINIFTSFNSKKSVKENKKNNQKAIDIVLEKISKSGYNSLNKDEKDLLFKASKK